MSDQAAVTQYSTEAMPDALPFPPFHDACLNREEAPGRLTELHLYHGSRCNRSCRFCCVEGRPEGNYTPFTETTLRAAVGLVAPRGSLKLYGGEPTLDTPNIVWAIQTLRKLGFAGAITLFSNGIRARDLVAILDSDREGNCRAVLNYSIATGRGERPLPPASLRLLQTYAAQHPDRLYLSHDFLIPVGRQTGKAAIAANGEPPAACFHCFPVLTSAGEFHACPFAVENTCQHFALGTSETPSITVQVNFARFQNTMRTQIEPEAARRKVNACQVCLETAAQS